MCVCVCVCVYVGRRLGEERFKRKYKSTGGTQTIEAWIKKSHMHTIHQGGTLLQCHTVLWKKTMIELSKGGIVMAMNPISQKTTCIIYDYSILYMDL